MRALTFLLLWVTTSTFGQGEFSQNLRDYISFRTSKGRYSGVTSIFHKGQLIFESTGGLANRSWSIPNKAQTRFNLASVTKMFTATGIGILIDRKLIGLDDPVKKHFPEFPDPEIAREVTVRELLSHTSGLSDFFFEKAYLETDKYRLRKLEDYDPFLSTLRLGTVPADGILYSNSNYIILGRIIEKVSEKSYYDFIQTEIFEKSGMSDSGFYEADLIVSNLAEGYSTDAQASMEFGIPNDKQVRKNTFMKAPKGMPAGGAYSTTHDMHRFFEALTTGKLLSPETLKEMTNPVHPGYGLGFQVYEQHGILVWGHSGGFYGVSTMAFYLPATAHTFISLTNADFAAQPVFDRFINLLTQQKVYMPVDMDLDSIKAYEGLFEVREGQMKGRQITIEAREDRLIFDKELEFYPMEKGEFFDIDNDFFVLRFSKGEDGTVGGFERTDNRNYQQRAVRIEADKAKTLTTLQVSEEVLRQYLGDYQFQENGMMAGHKPQITVDKGALLIDNMMRFLPFEKDKFFLQDDIGMQLHFQRGQTGEIHGIQVLREKEVVGEVKKLK